MPISIEIESCYCKYTIRKAVAVFIYKDNPKTQKELGSLQSIVFCNHPLYQFGVNHTNYIILPESWTRGLRSIIE
jgi:hypothetical protein